MSTGPNVAGLGLLGALYLLPALTGPSDGIPLPDADPARVRLRGPGRLADATPRWPRRSSPHPAPRHRPRV